MNRREFGRSFAAAMLQRPGRSVETLAGTGVAGYSGDGGLGRLAQMNNPYGLVVGPDGALYVCEIGNHVIRRIDLKTRIITTVAGSGKPGYSGDGGPATEALLNEPYEVRFDKTGNMFFVEMKNHLIRRVDARSKIISTVAGRPEPGFSGDGGPARDAQFRQPHSIAFDSRGRLLVCDIGNHRVRRIDLETGRIETYLGTGDRHPTPDGASIRGVSLNGPRALDLDPRGHLYLVLREGNRVYRIDPKTETIHHLAGSGEKGFAGDHNDARQALLNGPKGIAWSPDGGIYIADTENHAIRRIDLKTGLITTVLGDGSRGDGPEPDPRRCRTARPHGVFADRRGILYIGDSEAHRVRMLR
ncbi:MAG: hypothetical protein NZV14_18075 [Bryobacteraceae bacterium]|nr:hypothetical protein [Bryobacteraceae bacterium]MDW8380073.1 hypothetical protein [Bryobacterales bacterium]